MGRLDRTGRKANGARAWCGLPARNHNLRLRFYRPDFKLSRARRSDCSFVCHDLIKSAADRFSIFPGLLQLLRRKSLSRDLRRLDESWANARIKSHPNLNRNDLADVRSLAWYDQLGENQIVFAGCLRTRPGRAPDERPGESATFNVNAGVRSELFPMRIV